MKLKNILLHSVLSSLLIVSNLQATNGGSGGHGGISGGNGGHGGDAG